jgi:hypothetical protein
VSAHRYRWLDKPEIDATPGIGNEVGHAFVRLRTGTLPRMVLASR